MDLKDYARMVAGTQKAISEGLLEEDTQVLGAMEETFKTVEDFCEKNIEGFKSRGKVVNKVAFNSESGELSQEIDILYDNKPIQETEQAKYVEQIGAILSENLTNTGWEQDDDED